MNKAPMSTLITRVLGANERKPNLGMQNSNSPLFDTYIYNSACRFEYRYLEEA